MAVTSSTLTHHRRSEEDLSLVYLNVYDVNTDISNPFLRWLGLGSTLSCVQVQGHEYMFWKPGGVTESCLMNAWTHSTLIGLHNSILIGRTQLDQTRVREIIQQLRNSAEYNAESYNLFTNNCHHFSSRLCRQLMVDNPIPWWVNRFGIVGILCRCLLPGDNGHEPNSADYKGMIKADHDNDGACSDDDDHGDDDEEHQDDDNDDDTDDDDVDEPPYWKILRRQMRAMSRLPSTKQQEDQEAAASGAPVADGAVPSNGSSESSEALFDRASPFSCSGGSAHEQMRIRRSLSI